MPIAFKLVAVVAICLLGAAAWLGTHEPPAPKTMSDVTLDSKNFLK